MTREKILKILSHKDSMLDAGVSTFIVTKQNRLMPYEVTYNTTVFNDKILDETWQIYFEDIEYFEIA